MFIFLAYFILYNGLQFHPSHGEGDGRGLGWGTHVNPWLIHVNVWQNPLQYCKVISLQLIKTNGKRKIHLFKGLFSVFKRPLMVHYYIESLLSPDMGSKSLPSSSTLQPPSPLLNISIYTCTHTNPILVPLMQPIQDCLWIWSFFPYQDSSFIWPFLLWCSQKVAPSLSDMTLMKLLSQDMVY